MTGQREHLGGWVRRAFARTNDVDAKVDESRPWGWIAVVVLSLLGWSAFGYWLVQRFF